MQGRDIITTNEIQFISDQEARDLFDARARFHLQISGDEFVERWRRGDFDERREDPAVIAVVMLLPFVDEESRK